MILEKQDYMRKFVKKKNRPKKLTERNIDKLAKQADVFGGCGIFDVMLEQVEPEPTVNCKESMVISVSLWD